MEAQEIRYRVNKKVFRQASLYAMFLRNRNTCLLYTSPSPRD